MESIPYTAAYSKPALSISTVCKISEPYDASFDSGMHPPYHELNAIWDTGAMRSTISTKIARKLNLIPLGQTRVCHADGESFCNYYVVNLLLPNRMEIKMLMLNAGRLIISLFAEEWRMIAKLTFAVILFYKTAWWWLVVAFCLNVQPFTWKNIPNTCIYQKNALSLQSKRIKHLLIYKTKLKQWQKL